jgi:hypothetical protein
MTVKKIVLRILLNSINVQGLTSVNTVECGTAKVSRKVLTGELVKL